VARPLLGNGPPVTLAADDLRSDTRFRRTLEGLVGVPATEGNAVDVLRNGDEIFPAMLEAIRSAARTVDIMTFVYWTGDIAEEFADALAERAAHGVRVRVLLDSMGARLMDRTLCARMAGVGALVEWFRPLSRVPWKANHRTHRKVLVCDEGVGFTGGVGIAEEWCGDARNEREWRDTHLRVRGPAVDGLRAAFAEDWAETQHPLYDDRDRFPVQPQPGSSAVQVVRGSAGPGWGDMATAFRAVVKEAQHRLRITTAYFSPDDGFRRSLEEASGRGVDVHVLVPGPHHDKRIVQLASESEYEPLLEAGVRISAFQPSMLHAKVVTADGAVACVGSANFNNRSLDLDDELDLVIFDRDVVGVLDDHFEQDLARSTTLSTGRWRRRPVVQRVGEKVTAVIRREL
jgi:cardiolipin synthase